MSTTSTTTAPGRFTSIGTSDDSDFKGTESRREARQAVSNLLIAHKIETGGDDRAFRLAATLTMSMR